ncbi:hypothetical protein [Kamptonema sp. UHCC 0994]|uniref:hypothetical protein n=1 Tax=Kamptonema sp. UHCC 0994 TaxID=3031329 RepID=UPI0023BA3B29|nr:hypothetical protein [Kamptonema sp. UHCC 0994]MDF0553117.1 hypothetical protein [Kamptonema sp. UHCC 0994]
MKKVHSAREAFQFLIENPHITKVPSKGGHFRWGDAHSIVLFPDGIGSSGYEDEIVLVEIRGRRSQFQHWGFRFNRELFPMIKPTWFTNRVMLP